MVAALTIPSLIQKHQEKVTVAKLKKVYSAVSQAYMRAEQENGDIGTWGFNPGVRRGQDGKLTQVVYDNEKLFWSKLIPYMQVDSICFNNTDGKCTLKKSEFSLNEVNRSNNTAPATTNIKLTDGTMLAGGWIQEPYCPANTYCGDFYVDINGNENPPNTIGKDVFYFIIMKNKIVPWGNDERRFSTRCLNNGDGYGCTAWVIYNENMDYLHCNDLSWNGKHKCK